MIELFVTPIKGSDKYFLVIARGDEILLTHRGNETQAAALEFGRSWISRNAPRSTDYAQLRTLKGDA